MNCHGVYSQRLHIRFWCLNWPGCYRGRALNDCLRDEHRTRRLAVCPWFFDKDLTEDWVSHNFELWAELLGGMIGQRLEVLEIGSFEGRSGIFWLEFFPSLL
jgi:hypothetical protein